jgi:hypothetical protein
MTRTTRIDLGIRLLAVAALVVTSGCRTPTTEQDPAVTGTRTVRVAPHVREREDRTAPKPGSRYVTSIGLPNVGGAPSDASERLESFLRPIESIPVRSEKR